jgi:hypothetical protein
MLIGSSFEGLVGAAEAKIVVIEDSTASKR